MSMELRITVDAHDPAARSLSWSDALGAAVCARPAAAGATRVRRDEPPPPLSLGCIVMQDPEGDERCLDGGSARDVRR